jgi:hypothetical protein
MHVIRHFLGFSNGADSPFEAVVLGLGVIGSIIGWRKFVECHVDTCHKVGLHRVAGTPFIVCRGHHPHGGNTHEHVLAAHAHVVQAVRAVPKIDDAVEEIAANEAAPTNSG